jgi:hypothetical protein
MNATRTAVLVSFRDADEPRALASRLIATATRHPRGWSLEIPGVGATEHVTFDATALAVARRTGITRLLIVWAGADLA